MAANAISTCSRSCAVFRRPNRPRRQILVLQPERVGKKRPMESVERMPRHLTRCAAAGTQRRDEYIRVHHDAHPLQSRRPRYSAARVSSST